MQHSSITLEVYFRKVWKLLLPRLHHSDDIHVKSYVRIILGHPILIRPIGSDVYVYVLFIYLVNIVNTLTFRINQTKYRVFHSHVTEIK